MGCGRAYSASELVDADGDGVNDLIGKSPVAVLEASLGVRRGNGLGSEGCRRIKSPGETVDAGRCASTLA
jgi:hypothetical protein